MHSTLVIYCIRKPSISSWEPLSADPPFVSNQEKFTDILGRLLRSITGCCIDVARNVADEDINIIEEDTCMEGSKSRGVPAELSAAPYCH